jgi:uncharacterized damage-inducible protein DinB
MLSIKAHLGLMAHYNTVMNDRLIETVRPVGDAALLAPRGAFFGSILGTMNHLVVGDLLWLNRMRPYPFGRDLMTLDSLPKPVSLNDMPCPDLATYEPIRRQLDALLAGFIEDLGDDDLAAPFTYRNTKNEPFTKTLGLVLSHVFNHQTHHRGQITTLLSQAGLDIGSTDLAPMVPEL